ncbi:MAG: hypothetical protein JWL58_716, partial [Streptosporangiaceae bacterium]|nr:hypothetical protein [Streptosporangiaceae bacterium]
GLYAHASQRMRDELTAALQARWEESLRERAALDPHSPVPLLDNLLARFRDSATAITPPAGEPGLPRRLAREPVISQISPSTPTAPIRRVG